MSLCLIRGALNHIISLSLADDNVTDDAIRMGRCSYKAERC